MAPEGTIAGGRLQIVSAITATQAGKSLSSIRALAKVRNSPIGLGPFTPPRAAGKVNNTVMSPQLTPAAERALAYAGQWRRATTPAGADGGELGPAELLLGLLAEPECRAALLSTARGIDIAAVRARWPELQPAPVEIQGRPEHLSAEVVEALRTAERHLLDYPPPQELATEHLLLGLAMGQNEVGHWLATQGWDTHQLAAEIDRLAEHDAVRSILNWNRRPRMPLRPHRH